ncbi:hypothetical protein GSI_05127 [Ganoderma sinense ZZ0214-1]|uniref:Uncharacterized protein n=1 Tax=Ganoderma sinense ZZ0214-1 TaxID=1077348 RepID=A0A2G8SF67_9APHY|nr:hypothetical protein GSI_05127 [Ganoderma sinense ZZ0214-1]
MGHTSKTTRSASRKAGNGDAHSKTVSQAGFLPKEAYTILRTYCTQVTRHPSKAQFQELVGTIRRIPGCEGCQTKKLRAYFKERRKTEARARMAAEIKAKNRPKPVDIIGVAPTLPSSSQLSTLPAKPHPQSSQSPPLPTLRLHDPSPSRSNGVPTTFVDLSKWLKEVNARFTADLAYLEGLR